MLYRIFQIVKLSCIPCERILFTKIAFQNAMNYSLRNKWEKFLLINLIQKTCKYYFHLHNTCQEIYSIHTDKTFSIRYFSKHLYLPVHYISELSKRRLEINLSWYNLHLVSIIIPRLFYFRIYVRLCKKYIYINA